MESFTFVPKFHGPVTLLRSGGVGIVLMKPITMALDVGTVRIGVAVSDEERSMALPLETVDAKSHVEAVERIVELVDDYDVDEIVVGWPLDMQGREGRAVERVRRITSDLESKLRRDIPMVRWDERMTTSAADRLLVDADVSRSRRKEAVDQVAACKILEGYLESKQGSDGGER